MWNGDVNEIFADNDSHTFHQSIYLCIGEVCSISLFAAEYREDAVAGDVSTEFALTVHQLHVVPRLLLLVVVEVLKVWVRIVHFAQNLQYAWFQSVAVQRNHKFLVPFIVRSLPAVADIQRHVVPLPVLLLREEVVHEIVRSRIRLHNLYVRFKIYLLHSVSVSFMMLE